MIPNLFTFATSELSQDAMFCWLAAWAHSSYASVEPELNKTGTDFLQLLLGDGPTQTAPKQFSVTIGRQQSKIDVLIELNDTDVICIEDKAGTTDHSDQLIRYRELLAVGKHAGKRHHFAYIQTGDQGNYSQIRQAGYKVIRRHDLLGILSRYVGSNAILTDYREHLQAIETRARAWRSRPLSEWIGDWTSCAGFLTDLQTSFGTGTWAYIPNPSGGLLAYWWNEGSETQWAKYLQVKLYPTSGKAHLAFRMGSPGKDTLAQLRSEWWVRIREVCDARSFPVKKARTSHGESVDVAVCVGEFPLLVDGIVDMSQTLEILREATVVLKDSL